MQRMMGCFRVFFQGNPCIRSWCSGVCGFRDLALSDSLNQNGMQMLNGVCEPTEHQHCHDRIMQGINPMPWHTRHFGWRDSLRGGGTGHPVLLVGGLVRVCHGARYHSFQSPVRGNLAAPIYSPHASGIEFNMFNAWTCLGIHQLPARLRLNHPTQKHRTSP